jgi:hypothetical protein
MKCRTTILLAMFLGAAVALPLRAAGDPVWDAAEERAWRSRDLQAGLITTRTEIGNGDETLEIVEETERLTGWSAGQPVRTTETTRTVVHKSGMSVKINLSSAGNVFVAAREGRLARAYVRDETLNGRRCAVYHVEERPAPGKKDTAVAGEVWIDREGNIPIQGVFHPVKLPPNVKTYGMTIQYGLVGDYWAPSHASIQMSGGAMFIKRTLNVEKAFSGWTPPVAP